MPKKTKTKSRVAKSSLAKKSRFKLRWWMAVILVVVVVAIGVLVLRFSHAFSGSATFTASSGLVPIQNSQVYPTVGNGYNDSQYTAYPSVVGVGPDGVVKSQEAVTDAIGSASSGNVQVCWTYYSSENASKVFTLEIDAPGGGQIAVQPNVGIYAPSTQTTCVTHEVSQSDGILIYTMAMQSSSSGGRVGLIKVTRSTLSVQQPVGGQPSPVGPPVGSITPSNPNIQTLTFPAGQITTVCGYQAVAGYALICPQNILDWQFVGYTSSWVGTWQQNQAKGVTAQHDSGYWKWGNFCGVKSHVVSDPTLIYYGGDHMYLVGCPTASDLLSFKSANYRPTEAQQHTMGNIKITKHGPDNVGVCVKNRAGETFACNTENPVKLNNIWSDTNPYKAYTTAPTGWKVTKITVNGEPKYVDTNGIGTAFANFNVNTSQTTNVDFYYERK